MGKISSGRNLYRKAGFEDFGASNLVAPISNLGSEGLGQSPIKETAREYKFAGDALLARAQVEAEKRLLKAQKDAYKSARSGQKKVDCSAALVKLSVLLLQLQFQHCAMSV